MAHPTLSRILAVVALLAAVPVVLAHEPGGDNQLPGGGTLHELRITSVTSFTVAQQLTQPAICGFSSVCLQDEIHIPVVIDFTTGEIAIDATAPEDENENPVLPGEPGGILFNTQAGPAELVFAPPCENPDGCVGGSAIYLGTIDDAGNITFPSIGLNFELFGVEPIAQFNAVMGTGTSTDPSDPSVVAEGSPLDFSTGAVTFRGVQLVNSPIIGPALQLNTIQGTIVPIPVPPLASKLLIKCQKTIDKQGARFVKKKERELRRCVDALVACAIGAESGFPVPSGCEASAIDRCNRAVGRIATAEEQTAEKILKGCQSAGPANLLSTGQGLAFGVSAGQCSALGITDITSKDAIADCIGRSLACTVDRIVATVEPRAAEVLQANGFDQFVTPNGCVPAFAAGDATGTDGKVLTKCQQVLSKQASSFIKKKQKRLRKCVEAELACDIKDEAGEVTEAEHDACHVSADAICATAVSKIEQTVTKTIGKMQTACADFDVAGIPDLVGGLAFGELTETCGNLTPPISLDSLGELLTCIDTRLDCSVEGIVRTVTPRADDVLDEVSVNGDPLLDLFPCLAPSCGDGIVDVGEECDPDFDDADTCRDTCVLKVCGDSILDTDQGEECDDGNTESSDGCSDVCLIELFQCGNGVVEGFGGEVCDDGDTHGGDGCSGDCGSDETCGNTVVDTLVGEVCDDGGQVDGDGCSADCMSDETCGNGVIDTVTAEACDDGNTGNGDGCSSSCTFETCSFFGASALGTRSFTIDAAVGGLFNSIVGLGIPVGPIGFVSGSMDLVAGATDGSGNATVTLPSDVIIGLTVTGGGFTQCLKFEAVGTSGTLHCCGGHAVGMSFTRDSDGTGSNGPSIVLTGIGTGGVGDLEIAFQVSQGFASLATPGDCATTSYGSASTRFWTTGNATGRVVRPLQGPGGPPLEFSADGQAFDCSNWTTTDDVGALVNTDTAMDAIAGIFDAANMRILDDNGGN